MSRRKRAYNPTKNTHTHIFSFSDIALPEDMPITGYVDRMLNDLKQRRLDTLAQMQSGSGDAPAVVEPYAYKRYDMGAAFESYHTGDDEEPEPFKNKGPRVVKPSDKSLYDWLEGKVDIYGAEFEVWDGEFFRKKPLAELGLCVQLSHPPVGRGSHCTVPLPSKGGFVTLHTNGIHEVNVDFCSCEHANANGPPEVQLLRIGWFPATHERPHTAATFEVLCQFHLETLQAKVTMYDFYRVLEHLMDNTGVKPPDRYHEWIRMCREWRHLMMLKRAGRLHAYNSSGAAGTKSGEHLYTFYIALDACFHLKRRLVSNELKDPGLGTGLAYMTENEPYPEYLRGVMHQKEMNTCSGLTADGGARHEFVQPNGVGDLQRGKRFANMDYIFGSIMRHKHPGIWKWVTYDIVCIWSKFLKERMEALPPLVCLTIIWLLFSFAIPKMHIHSHTLLCQLLYSLNLLQGSGQLDAEAIECAWAAISAWSFWNWVKLIGIVASLRWQIDKARVELADQEAAFAEFLREQAHLVPAWKQKVDEFEADPTKPNPYEVKFVGLTEAQVRLQFTQEEAKQAQLGAPALHDVSLSKFILLGLDLEDKQRRIHVQAVLKKANTTEMQINLGSMRTKLNRRIGQFRKLQSTYTPAALQELGELDIPEDHVIENMPLMLLSAMSLLAQSVGCLAGLTDIEALLCHVQCRTALASLQNQLHIKTRLLVYKKGHARHVGANTRSHTIVARNESKIGLHSEKYQMAWDAIRLLRNDWDGSKVPWQPLKQQDIRCMEDTEDLEKKRKHREAHKELVRKRNAKLIRAGLLDAEKEDNMDIDDNDNEGPVPENRRQIFWIWTVAGTSGTDAELEDALRIEWLKAYAWVCWWREEVELLEVEYERGTIAFAKKQAQMYRDLDTPQGDDLDGGETFAGEETMDAAVCEDEERIREERRTEEEEEEEELLGGAVESDDEEYIFSGAVED
ncbi:CxC2 domain-containing protein [Mycena venus]|uniref:CxC2 domain-containing protein n=1 Tax=Mycena venus TaxID=2733690 RepID=A0A8H6TZC7_9AGAR|nr:CxC2 domain-containing protein [Mycena venus]